MTLRVMDCSRRIPLNTKVSSALALHFDVPIVAPCPLRTGTLNAYLKNYLQSD
jgi:hypothetical protein